MGSPRKSRDRSSAGAALPSHCCHTCHSAACLRRSCDHSSAGIDTYSQRCLRRIWRAERFSWWLTSLLHKFPDTGGFGQKMQAAELDYLVNSVAASTAMAENYVGLAM